MTDEPMWNAEDVAKLLGVSKRTVQKWADSGEIPAVLLGKLWRFRPATIRTWLSEREKVSP